MDSIIFVFADIVEENFLIFSDPYSRQIYQLDMASTDQPFPEPQGVAIDNFEYPQMVEYDQVLF